MFKDLVMEEGGQPVRALVVSTWRSGSTFVGEFSNGKWLVQKDQTFSSLVNSYY